MNLDELILEKSGRPQFYKSKAIFVMGPPGSGKNTIIDQLFSSSEFKIDDFDEIMQRYKALGKSNNDEYSHSYQLAIQRRNLWLKNKLGLIINTTGRRQNNVIELKDLLEANGYSTFGIFVKAPYDVALKRVIERPQISNKIADKDRKVDTEFFDKAYIASVANLKVFKSVFNPANFSVIVNDSDSEFYKPSLDNAVRSIKRFLNRK